MGFRRLPSILCACLFPAVVGESSSPVILCGEMCGFTKVAPCFRVLVSLRVTFAPTSPSRMASRYRVSLNQCRRSQKSSIDEVFPSWRDRPAFPGRSFKSSRCSLAEGFPMSRRNSCLCKGSHPGRSRLGYSSSRADRRVDLSSPLTPRAGRSPGCLQRRRQR